MRRVALLALVLAAPVLPWAAPVVSDPSLVPGRMGYNALPALAAPEPEIGDEIALEVSAIAQASSLGRADDASALPYVRAYVPFGRVAALEVEAIPFEVWRVGPSTQQRLDATHASGTAKGDVRVSAQFAVLDETARAPALGLRVFTKTASGKGAEDRRFLDAPAYSVDLAAGKSLPWRVGRFEVRTVASAGFLAWQQGAGRQDDAFTAAARIALRSGREIRLALDWRAYWGYQQLDKPMVLGVAAGRRLARALELLAAIDRGLTADAPPWAVRLGVVLYLDSPWPGSR